MSLPSFSIKRNVLTLMVSLVLVLFGLIGFLRLCGQAYRGEQQRVDCGFHRV